MQRKVKQASAFSSSRSSSSTSKTRNGAVVSDNIARTNSDTNTGAKSRPGAKTGPITDNMRIDRYSIRSVYAGLNVGLSAASSSSLSSSSSAPPSSVKNTTVATEYNCKQRLDASLEDSSFDEMTVYCRSCGDQLEGGVASIAGCGRLDNQSGNWCNKYEVEGCEEYVECQRCVTRAECSTCGFYVCPYCKEMDAVSSSSSSSNNTLSVNDAPPVYQDEEHLYDTRIFVVPCGGCRRNTCTKALRGSPQIACMIHCDFCHKNLCPRCTGGGKTMVCKPCKREWDLTANEFSCGPECTTMCTNCVLAKKKFVCEQHLEEDDDDDGASN